VTGRWARVAYVPGTTWLHRMHPVVKAGWLIFGSVFVFIVRSPWVVLSVLGGLVALWLLLAPGRVRGLRLAVGTSVVLAVLQMLFNSDGAPWIALGPLRLTDEGMRWGLYIGSRFLDVVLLSYLFVLTTEPNLLAYGLMQVGLPYRFGFALVTALRMVPIFEQEGETVYRAQLARGVAYDWSGPRRWLTLARQFFLPLLVSALGKVDAMAVSMEGRGFGQYPRRTFLREVRFRRADGVALGVLFFAVVGSIWWVVSV
jgi:energy-coupling factor transport system permease protein